MFGGLHEPLTLELLRSPESDNFSKNAGHLINSWTPKIQAPKRILVDFSPSGLPTKYFCCIRQTESPGKRKPWSRTKKKPKYNTGVLAKMVKQPFSPQSRWRRPAGEILAKTKAASVTFFCSFFLQFWWVHSLNVFFFVGGGVGLKIIKVYVVLGVRSWHLWVEMKIAPQGTFTEKSKWQILGK